MTIYGIMEYVNLPYHEQESYLHNPLYKEKWRAEEEKRRLEVLDYKYHEYDVVEYEVEEIKERDIINDARSSRRGLETVKEGVEFSNLIKRFL